MCELEQMHQNLNMIIYQTHLIEKQFEAQATYRALADLIEIAKGTARQDVLTTEYVESAKQRLVNTLTQRVKLDSDFMGMTTATEQISFLVTQAKANIPPAIERNIHFTPCEREELELADALKKIKQLEQTKEKWESGWLSGESLKNQKLTSALRKIKYIASEQGYADIEKLCTIRD